jgi:hypothetical protein
MTTERERPDDETQARSTNLPGERSGNDPTGAAMEEIVRQRLERLRKKVEESEDEDPNIYPLF